MPSLDAHIFPFFGNAGALFTFNWGQVTFQVQVPRVMIPGGLHPMDGSPPVTLTDAVDENVPAVLNVAGSGGFH
jgi:hypothetical protein